MISFHEALRLTLEKVQPLGTELIALSQATGRVAGESLVARVDLPSVDVSLKDGYAVRSGDISVASPERPVFLHLIGDVAAGGLWQGETRPGTAVRILSGAPIPTGAEAVVSEEFTRLEGQDLIVVADAYPGRNILSRGSDLQRGQLLVSAGEPLWPGQIGLLAAGGQERIPVRKIPRVGILATGDEVLAPGKPLEDGKVYASNLVTLEAWCHYFYMQVTTWVVEDQPDALRAHLQESIGECDALLTSGGAWKGDRDLVVGVLDELGWEKLYHRVRIGPGKAVGFGKYRGKPVFCLPGGPPSNYMAFLNLALPGLLKLGGRIRTSFPVVPAKLSREVRGQIDWTQFILGKIEEGQDCLIFHPAEMTSRLQMIAQAEAILTIPEGTDHIAARENVSVQMLGNPDWA
jgi:molybdopterin molybdotransferase